MDQLSINGERTQLGGPADGAPTALAAACWAAGELLARAGQLSRLRVRFGEVCVDLHWPAVPAAPATPATAAAPAAPAAAGGQAESAAGAPAESTAEPAEPPDPGLAYVRAPMVGTFYHAPAPDAPPFVEVGDLVEAGQQIGIVEAMKLMNSVEADQPGRVIEIVVDNGAPVEFDQPLIAIAPLGSDQEEYREQRCSPPY